MAHRSRTQRLVFLVGSACSLLLLLRAAPAQATPGAILAATAVAQSAPQRFDGADFLETQPKDIAMENRANPLQAWALAFLRTLLLKGTTIALAMTLSEKYAWAPYLPLIPTLGHSHFWETKMWWAGLIALAGDFIGSGMLAYYFGQVNVSTAATRPAHTMLYAGISVLAIFWIYENITAPVFAMWRNRQLRKQFTPAVEKDKDKDKGAASGLPNSRWRRSPWPARGLASIGPDLRAPTPIGAGWSFSF